MLKKESISVETKIFSKVGYNFKFGGTLGRPHGTLGFRGTPVEKHCTRPWLLALVTLMIFTFGMKNLIKLSK
jgi:hypothetical protein